MQRSLRSFHALQTCDHPSGQILGGEAAPCRRDIRRLQKLEPAAGFDVLTGDPAAIAGCKERNNAGDIFGRSEPPERGLTFHVANGGRIFARGCIALRGDPTRRHGVHGDTS